MNLIKRKNIIKNKFKDVEKITLCKLSLESDPDALGYKNLNYIINIESSGVFKMLEINYIGKIIKVNSNYPNIIIKVNKHKNKIVILNPFKQKIQDGAFLRFRGLITKFQKVVVFGWGQSHFIAETELPSDTKSNINTNENIVGISSDKFYD